MKVLITGGSGLIGKALTIRLIAEGHQVNILTRKITNKSAAKEFTWNGQSIDSKAFENVEVLVHLAGAGIADKKWTSERKQEIIDSRVKSLELISEKYTGTSLKAIIGGSAVGYYGGDSGETENNENSPHGKDFMAECCLKWEKAEEAFAKKLNLRLVKVRTGVVLDSADGALPQIIKPIKYYAGTALGSGKQWMSWIHIDDIVEIFYQAIVNEQIKGTTNGVAPNPVRNQDFTKLAAEVMNRKLFLPNAPAFILKMILGEMSVVVLGSSRVYNKQTLPFVFKYEYLENALRNLLTQK
ncbi:TIGR01777 family protein [Lacihabitans sp. CCS-44]|uniref:TIGR01777 family oxidoreductase n=1 Tax=Lacihabitans sp. CCS-44 TaxID=2487331 RepID=UPI0020CF916C|nr:TIGR01777 family oxidoreductase [Lacihabitans sp. CCS-44]MCP9753664.1 TIGR01777 family protein [Lacihabitans sp. CCS-44]